MSKIVIALGGNALGKNPSEQLSLLKDVAKIIVDLVKDGNKIILTHGNGPQVGQIALAMEYASNGEAGTPMMPFPECGSMSQGYIGYQLQQCIQNELKKQNISKNCVTLITQVLVDSKDSAFQNPSKPIGMFYTKEEALDIEKEKGYTMIEDATIKMLFDNNNIVIASGGGGIPVIMENGAYKGVEAVIDKDRTAALLAKLTMADTLMILTAVEKVSLNYNTENQVDLDVITIKDANKYISENQFAKGSMLPKVEASMSFVEDSDDRKAIISSLEKANLAIKGKTGTIIKRR